jgi:hypothetical protein
MDEQPAYLGWIDSLGSTFGKVWTAVNPPKANNTVTPEGTNKTPEWLAPVGIGAAALVLVLIVLSLFRK